MTMARFSENTVEYVLGAFEEPDELVIMNNFSGIEIQYDDESKLPVVKCVMLKEITAFAELWYVDHNTYDGIDAVSDADWKAHINRHAAVKWVGQVPSTMTRSNTAITPNQYQMAGSIQKPLSIKLADFPSFNGKMSQWMTFHTEFTSTICNYKMGDLIADNPNHNSLMTMDVTYKER